MKNKKRLVISFVLVFFIFGVSLPLFITNHRKVKADTISDLTNTTWIFNDSIVFDWNIYGHFSINFTSNNVNYTQFYMTDDEEHSIYYDNTNVYYWNWESVNYKTITITGGTHATNSNLIYLITSNATQQQPTPSGTRILYKYWAPYGVIQMTNNQVVGDDDIEYTILFNEYTNTIYETPSTGLRFYGIDTDSQNDPFSAIVSYTDGGINLLYAHDDSNNIDNAMWLEFTYGDYMDTELYNFMDLWGHWFDDGDAYIVGMNQGYVEGEIHGRALGQADGTQYTGLVTGIFNGLGGLLSIQVFPNITIGLLIGLPLLLGVLIIIIKLLRG